MVLGRVSDVHGNPGIFALQFTAPARSGRYETAWTMLHKLRKAMVAPEWSLLTGEAEVDECGVGGSKTGRKGGRSNIAAAAKVAVAVEVRGQGSGRVRMQIIHDASAETLEAFVMANVALGAVVPTDGWMGYARLPKGCEHRLRSQRAAKREGNPAPIMSRVHRAISNFKSWLQGTHRSVSAEHLQVYLDEFTSATTAGQHP